MVEEPASSHSDTPALSLCAHKQQARSSWLFCVWQADKVERTCAVFVFITHCCQTTLKLPNMAYDCMRQWWLTCVDVCVCVCVCIGQHIFDIHSANCACGKTICWPFLVIVSSFLPSLLFCLVHTQTHAHKSFKAPLYSVRRGLRTVNN